MLRLRPYKPASKQLGKNIPETTNLLALLLTLASENEKIGSSETSARSGIKIQYQILKQLSVSQLVHILVIQDDAVRELIIRILNELPVLELVDAPASNNNELCVSSYEFELLTRFLDFQPKNSTHLLFNLISIAGTKQFSKVDMLIKQHCQFLKISNTKLENISTSTTLLDKVRVVSLVDNANIEVLDKLMNWNELEVVGNQMDVNLLKDLLLKYSSKLTTVGFKERLVNEESTADDAILFANNDTRTTIKLDFVLCTELSNEQFINYGVGNFTGLNINLIKDFKNIDLDFLLSNLTNLAKLSINGILNVSHFAVSFDSRTVKNSQLKQLSFTRCKFTNSNFEGLKNLESLVLLECQLNASELKTITGNKFLKKLSLINCELTWDDYIDLPEQLETLTIHNNNTDSCKDICFGSYSMVDDESTEPKKVLNNNLVLDINSVKTNLKHSIFKKLVVFKLVNSFKIKFPIEPIKKLLEFVFIPNLNAVDFKLLNLKELKNVEKITFKLYSFSNTFYKPKNLPKNSGFEYEFKYINLNHLEEQEEDEDEDENQPVFETSLSTYSSDTNRYDEDEEIDEEEIAEKKKKGTLTIGELKKHKRISKLKELQSWGMSPKDIHKKLPSDNEFEFESESDIDVDEEELRQYVEQKEREMELDDEEDNGEDLDDEEKKKSKLIRNVISSKNILPALNPKDDDKPFECEYCPKAFKRKEHLRRHSLTHTNYRPHICSKCGRGFRRSDNLKNHQRRCFSSKNADGTGYRLKVDPKRLDAVEIERVKKLEQAKKLSFKKWKSTAKSMKLSEFDSLDKSTKDLTSRKPVPSNIKDQDKDASIGDRFNVFSVVSPEVKPEVYALNSIKGDSEEPESESPLSKESDGDESMSVEPSTSSVASETIKTEKKHFVPEGGIPSVSTKVEDIPKHSSGVLKLKKKNLLTSINKLESDTKEEEGDESMTDVKSSGIASSAEGDTLESTNNGDDTTSETAPRTKSGRAVKLPDKFKEETDVATKRTYKKRTHDSVDQDAEDEEEDTRQSEDENENENENEDDEDEDDEEEGYSREDGGEDGFDTEGDHTVFYDEKVERIKAIKVQVNQEFSKCEILPDDSFRCSKCKKIFTKRGNLKRHLIIHFNLKPYICECGKGFKRSDNFQKHTSCCKKLASWKRHKKRRMMIVKKKDGEDYDEEDQDQEMETTSDKIPTKKDGDSETDEDDDEEEEEEGEGEEGDDGEILPRKPTSSSSSASSDAKLDKKTLTKLKNKQGWDCVDCGRVFRRKYHLQRHELIHQNLDDKPFSCGNCGSSFKRDDLLEKHLTANKCNSQSVVVETTILPLIDEGEERSNVEKVRPGIVN